MSTTARIDTRFSSFLAGQHVDVQGRRRLITSAVAAAVTVSIAGAMGWTADKLGVAAVDAPTANVMITIDLGPPPPPAVKPPPPPSAGGAAASDEAPDEPRERPKPVSDDAPPLDDLQPVRGTSTVPGNAGVPGGPGVRGVPGGGGPPGFSGPRCLAPPCDPGGRNRPPTETRRVVTQPVSVVKANAIFSPDPDQRRLGRTKSGLMRRPGTAKSSVSFCVAASGKVVDVRTSKRYPGDTEVDRICREAVAKWRFRPFVVDGKARKTCTTTTFAIEFE